MKIFQGGDSIAGTNKGSQDDSSYSGARNRLQDDSFGMAAEERLQHLEAWLCDLLIKNQQLRMAIHELTQEREGKCSSLQKDD